MDITDLKKKKTALCDESEKLTAECTANISRAHKTNAPLKKRCEEIHLQIQMLDKALANPAAAASIAAFIVSQSAQKNSEK